MFLALSDLKLSVLLRRLLVRRRQGTGKGMLCSLKGKGCFVHSIPAKQCPCYINY